MFEERRLKKRLQNELKNVQNRGVQLVPEPPMVLSGYGVEGDIEPQVSVKFDRELVASIVAPDRYYGDGNTIHGTNTIDIVLDPDTGDVCEVWFRCQMLRFNQSKRKSHPQRQEDLPYLRGVVISDPK